MPVNTTHPTYSDFHPQWSKCRDAYDGSDTIKSMGIKYLPSLSEQTSEEYRAYKDRALFYSITAKTIQSLVGLAMQQEPNIQFPEDMSRYFKDNSGVEFYELLGSSYSETLLMGRFGILIDRPVVGGPPKPIPYICESIINWEIDSNGEFTLVVLVESILKADPIDRFKKIYETQYRVLELIDGVYTQTIYGKDLKAGVTVVPTNSGVSMDFIPFFMITPAGIGSQIAKSPVLDIVDINISHYRTSADLEHGRHFTGLPTPVAIGVDADTKLRVGSMTAWVIPNHLGDAKYLEFTGEGLKSLEFALAEKQTQLASLSARLVDSSNKGSESPETVKLRYASENASLVTVSRSVEAFVNVIYKAIAYMESFDPNEVSITLNKDFLSRTLTGKEVGEYIDSYFSGGLSLEALIYNLRRGGVFDPKRTDDDEKTSIIEAAKKAESAKAALEAKSKLSTNLGA